MGEGNRRVSDTFGGSSVARGGAVDYQVQITNWGSFPFVH